MNRFDRIKSYVGFILLAIVLIPFTFLGKDDPITRYAAVSSLILWLLVMYWANMQKKKSDG